MYTGPMRIAHRGDVSKAPENTLEAVRAAYEGGFEGVEIDVRLTKDRKVVLAHDETLRRVTSGGPQQRDWRYRDRDWQEIEETPLPYWNHLLPPLPQDGMSEEELSAVLDKVQFGRDPAHPHMLERSIDPRTARPVLFEEVLEWVVRQNTNFTIEVECKEMGLPEFLLEVLRRVGGAERCIFFSGDWETVQELAAYFLPGTRPPGLRIGANIRTYNDDWRRRLTGLSVDVVDLNAFAVERSDIAELERNGYEVLSNLGDFPSWWEKIISWGFKGFKTNYPEAYSRWWRRDVSTQEDRPY